MVRANNGTVPCLGYMWGQSLPQPGRLLLTVHNTPVTVPHLEGQTRFRPPTTLPHKTTPTYSSSTPTPNNRTLVPTPHMDTLTKPTHVHHITTTPKLTPVPTPCTTIPPK